MSEADDTRARASTPAATSAGNDPTAPARPPRISILVPTYRRPDDLANCIASILAQTRRPDELLLIDDGDLEVVPHADALAEAGIALVYRRKDTPGVTESRNLGARIASGDVIFLSEDDVVLEPEYVERIMAVYESDPDRRIGGVGGIITNERRDRLRGLVQLVVFLVFRIAGLREGRILRSGFSSDYGECLLRIRRLAPVDFLLGGVSSFRREVFEEFSFSNSYRSRSGYGQGEDKEFSYRVSRRWMLMLEPRARLAHYPAPKRNYELRVRGRAMALSRWFFFREQVRRSVLDDAQFFYALTGYTLYRTAIMLVKPTRAERERVLGLLSGWRLILTGARLDQL